MWSFVAKKGNRPCIWIAMDAKARRVIAFTWGIAVENVGHSCVPRFPRCIHTRRYSIRIYMRHLKGLSRLTRETLSFSKKLARHFGVIKYFICRDNLVRAAALPV